MALFNKTAKDTPTEKKADSVTTAHRVSGTLLSPRVTEKAAIVAEKGTYVFEVQRNATKNEIKKEIERVYKVTPVKVRTVQLPHKAISRQGKKGLKGGVKKAYVTLKEGDKIEIF